MNSNDDSRPLTRAELRRLREDSEATAPAEPSFDAPETADSRDRDMDELLSPSHDVATEGRVATAKSGGKKAKPRRKATFFSVLGELLITAALVVFLYVAWQMWIGDLIFGAKLQSVATETSDQWADDFANGRLELPEITQNDAGTWDPPLMAEPADAEVFATMRVPRFGDDYAVEMAGGVSRARTLDNIGLGHYPGTQMPGQLGNFAIAGHRTTWGKPLNQIDQLQLNDAIVVETPAGWYTYRFRTMQYVVPSQVDVLNEVPQVPGVPATEAYITLTACSPMYSLAERIVAYGTFESFQPRSEGLPASLTEGVS